MQAGTARTGTGGSVHVASGSGSKVSETTGAIKVQSPSADASGSVKIDGSSISASIGQGETSGNFAVHILQSQSVSGSATVTAGHSAEETGGTIQLQSGGGKFSGKAYHKPLP